MSRSWVWALTAALLLVVALSMFREPLGRMLFPDAALAGLLAQAEQALAAGDAAGAASRFRAAEARAPDHPRVASGLAETRELALHQASLAIDAGDAARVARAIEDAAALGAPGDRLEGLRRAWAARATPTLDALLQRAATMEPDDPALALALYREALGLAPDHAVARNGRTRLLEGRLVEADAALARGDAVRARALVAEVKALDPAHLGLPERAMRLSALFPVPEPTHVEVHRPALEALAEASRWRGIAEEAIGRGALADAGQALDRAEALEPGAPALAELRERLARLQAAKPPRR